MIKYITVSDKQSFVLNLMGREKTFTKGEEVFEDSYTNAYPQYFKRIGEVKGYSSFLSTPVFEPDTISDFVKKETVRKETITKVPQKPKEVEIDELSKALETVIENSIDVDIDANDIKSMLNKEVQEEFPTEGSEPDVTFLTEE